MASGNAGGNWAELIFLDESFSCVAGKLSLQISFKIKSDKLV